MSDEIDQMVSHLRGAGDKLSSDAANVITRLRAQLEDAFCRANPLVSKCETCGELIVYPTKSA